MPFKGKVVSLRWVILMCVFLLVFSHIELSVAMGLFNFIVQIVICSNNS